MVQNKQTWGRKAESGAALLIAIFALLLISVIAIALVVTSGTDAALGGNYRTSAGAYFAAAAGLEEARGRLLWKNPDYLNNNKPNSFPTLLSPNGLPTWGLTQVFYIINPAAGETVNPLSANPADYPDSEYQPEFGWPLAGTTVNQIPSVSGAAGLPGPSYKWVRITPATEWSLQMDVDGDGNKDHTAVLYYDPAHVDSSNRPAPGLIASLVPIPAPAVQALEITSLAVLPNGARRMLQYVVVPLIVVPGAPNNGYPFPAALTLDGSGVQFSAPGAPNYKVDGQDASNATAGVASIGYTNTADLATITAQATPNPNYPGSPIVPVNKPSPGSFLYLNNPPVSLQQTWQTPKTLDALAQDITSTADVVINKTSANGSDISNSAPTMSATNPMTIVVNGDLSLTGWHNTGYGLLLVTGVLNYDPDASWNGLVLVIGQGVFYSSKNGTGGIQGAVLVAKTRDGSGILLNSTTLGIPTFEGQPSYGSSPGTGIKYNSCVILGGCNGTNPPIGGAAGPLTYKVLSFHEIALAN